MNTIEKGVDTKRSKNNKLQILASKKEVEYFVQCGNHQGKDNVLFFDDKSSQKEVFLLLHGGKNGMVAFNNKLLTLKAIYQELQKENVFNLLIALNIKYIQVLCCYGGYINSYVDKETGITIKPFFHNKGVLLGKPTSENSFEFTPTDLVA